MDAELHAAVAASKAAVLAAAAGSPRLIVDPMLDLAEATSSSSPPTAPPATGKEQRIESGTTASSSAPATGSAGYPSVGSGAASSSSAPAPSFSSASPASGSGVATQSSALDAFLPKLMRCECGKQADPPFCKRFLKSPEQASLCRECKAVVVLQGQVQVDKYCYSGWLFSRKKKLLRLSKDKEELIFGAMHHSAWQVTVPLKELIGVVFGAYTLTFKKQSAKSSPPHWAAFSLVARDRTYDFSCRDPEIVECCVRTFQQLIWDRRYSLAIGKSPKPSIAIKCGRAEEIIDRDRDIICPGLGAFRPWPTGFFLWMRLRFRLQEEAQKRNLEPDHMLWTVFMRAAFLSDNEVTKARFIDMAEKLQTEHAFTLANEMRDLSVKIQFQKEREMDIVKDRYECHIDTFLPSAPTAVTGGATKRTSQLIPIPTTPSSASKRNETTTAPKAPSSPTISSVAPATPMSQDSAI